ncbi:MAG: L,D-transpeptidase family protein [Nocardioidaceae bacterium]
MRRIRTLAKGLIATLVAVLFAAGAVYGFVAMTGNAGSARQAAEVTAASSAPPSSTAPAPQSPAPSDPPEGTSAPSTHRSVLGPGDDGTKVRELQSRLKQLQWYAPDVTGSYDRTTKAAVKGFQEKRDFPATGVVDRRTWRRVVKMSEMPTDDEMHNRLVPGPTILGPGDSGGQVRELQARLKQIGWFGEEVTDRYGDVTRTAVTGFQDKRAIPSTGKVDQRTMDRLLAMTHEPTGDELHNRYPSSGANAPLDKRCRTGRTLCIDKSTNSLRWVIDGSVRMTVDVRFGADETPTRDGRFAVTFKSRDHVSSLFHTPMPYAMFFSGGQAVHYSSDFAARGYAGASHGCVNVRDLDAVKSLFDQVRVGDKVIVYWS